eukprot:s4704_g10.t1
MRREARELPAGSLCREAWKAVSRRLQAERRKWKAILADKAGSHDWNALRSLKAKASKTNWAAALLDDPEWADKLRKHMSAIFHKQPPDATRKAMQGLRVDAARLCKSCPWRPFSEQEMRLTMAKWKNHKATGPDGIAMEALKLLFDHEVWKPRLAELLNDCLYRGELTPCIATGASVLLPKKAKPASWTDTRPITLSSAILKWLAQLLLLRGQPLLQDVCQHQWASKGKQGVELILSLRKLARVAHEWKTPFYVVKIDIAKAFDSVAQEKLADLAQGVPGPRDLLHDPDLQEREPGPHALLHDSDLPDQDLDMISYSLLVLDYKKTRLYLLYDIADQDLVTPYTIQKHATVTQYDIKSPLIYHCETPLPQRYPWQRPLHPWHHPHWWTQDRTLSEAASHINHNS